MKVAIIGSRNIEIREIERYIPENITEIVSGGARGIDLCAADYARKKGILLTEFLPEYNIYGRGAPIVRNKKIVDHSDVVIAFWNGSSKGTRSVIDYCKKVGKECKVVYVEV